MSKNQNKKTVPTTVGKSSPEGFRGQLREMIEGSEDLAEALKDVMAGFLQEVLEAEMDDALGAGKSERSSSRLGYRSGHYRRGLVTRVGPIELRVPQDRAGLFSTEVFERYQRSEKALVTSLIDMYVQGVSTRKVAKITEDLCGHGFSKSAVSRSVEGLDEQLGSFSERTLEVEYPYLILDARYEKVRDEDGVVRDRAVLVALGINWEGRREVLAVEIAPKESAGHWRVFLEKLLSRGLRGVDLVVSDCHSGLTKAIRECLPGVKWQRCYVHFLRNAIDHLSRRSDKECLRQLRMIYDYGSLEAARLALGTWLREWSESEPRLCRWVEEEIEQTLTYLSLPLGHHKHLKSTNMLERVNQELKRRTNIVRIFPNEASCLRLSRAVASEIHDGWIEQHRYLDMEPLAEAQRTSLSKQEETAA